MVKLAFKMLIFVILTNQKFIISNQDEFSYEDSSYKLLYAPWRTNSCPTNSNTKLEWKKECPFCHQFAVDEDEKHYIIKRLKHNVIMLNLHPYGPGHLMIVPYQHASSLDQLSMEVRVELMEALSQTTTILKSVLRYHGINIGINIGGKGTGGSIPDHIHFHLVPRWEGDNSFMASIAGTRIISCEMNEMYKLLLTTFNDLT